MNLGRSNFTEEKTMRQTRPEMRGPQDISDILSGLKTKTINIQEPLPQQSANDSSTISIQDLKDLGDANMPKRSGRRKKSSSNTLSLDI